jgi:hypothetical protein
MIMDRTFNVEFTTTLTAIVSVIVTEAQLYDIALELKVPVDKLTASDLDVEDRAYEELPSSLCAPCSGWNSSYTAEISDWEASGEEPEETTDAK